ncbi:unnamed protein product [Closterium sp. NIES-65]|nr:unnamed protein product [Closterium sp. NIES-65]
MLPLNTQVQRSLAAAASDCQRSLAAAAVPDTRPSLAGAAGVGLGAGREGMGAGRGGAGEGAGGGVVRAVAAALPSVVGIVVGGTVWGSGHEQQQEQGFDTKSSSTSASDWLNGRRQQVETCQSTVERRGEQAHRSKGGQRGGRVAAMVLTTAAVHAGASGGAVVNAQGEMIALVTSNAKHNRHGTILPHLNFSIPLSLLRPIFHFASSLHSSFHSSLHSSLHSSHYSSHHPAHHTSQPPQSPPPPFSPAWASVVHPLLSRFLLPLNTPSPAIHALWSLASSHLTPPDIPRPPPSLSRLITPSVRTNKPKL